MAVWLFNPCSPCCITEECKDKLFFGLFFPCPEAGSCNDYSYGISVDPDLFPLNGESYLNFFGGGCGSDTIPDLYFFLDIANIIPRNEIQVLDEAFASTGTYDLTGNSHTETISSPSTLISIQSAIDNIYGIGAATVSGDDGGPYYIEFDGSLAKTRLPVLQISDNTTDSDPYAYISQDAIEEWSTSYLDIMVSLIGANNVTGCYFTIAPFIFSNIVVSYPGPSNVPQWDQNIDFSGSYQTYSHYYNGNNSDTSGVFYPNRPVFRIRVFKDCSVEVFFPETKAECCPNIPETLSVSAVLDFACATDPPAHFDDSFTITYNSSYKLWRGGSNFTHDYDWFGETRTADYYLECFMECLFDGTIRVWFVLWGETSGFPTSLLDYFSYFPASHIMSYTVSEPLYVSGSTNMYGYSICFGDTPSPLSFTITE